MTKTFNKNSIIPVNEELIVVIDKDEGIKDKGYAYNTIDNEIVFAHRDEFAAFLERSTTLVNGTEFKKIFYPIVAIIGKYDNPYPVPIPVILLPDEIENAFYNIFPKYQKTDFDTLKEGFKYGYEANNKKYSEEDVRKAIRMAQLCTPFETTAEGNPVLDVEYQYGEDEIIQSIQKPKVPTSICLGYECIYKGKCIKDRCLIHPCDEHILKTNSNNEVMPEKILYD